MAKAVLESVAKQPSDKPLIRRAFTAAAPRYDGLAEVQRRIADTLVQAIAGNASGLALDAGSGTGYLGRVLARHAPGLQLIGCDLAERMLRQGGTPGIAADLEALPLAAASLDLYLSSLAWQWADAARAIAEATRVLRPDGQLHVATLGPASLLELREAFRHADADEHVRAFLPQASLAGLFDPALWRGLELRSQVFHVHAADVRSLLEGVRGIGAGVLAQRPAGLFGKRRWQRMEAAYEARREAAGLPLSYEAIFITATRA